MALALYDSIDNHAQRSLEKVETRGGSFEEKAAKLVVSGRLSSMRLFRLGLSYVFTLGSAQKRVLSVTGRFLVVDVMRRRCDRSPRSHRFLAVGTVSPKTESRISFGLPEEFFLNFSDRRELAR
jgi:hypothetical protein